jgi:hypothetical protein
MLYLITLREGGGEVTLVTLSLDACTTSEFGLAAPGSADRPKGDADLRYLGDGTQRAAR